MGPIGFAIPWILIGLIALPIIWWLLRAVPPAAVKRRFPAVSLLLGLNDTETTPIKTPWWLLLLRLFALAAVIIGFAEPILNPNEQSLSRKPLLVAMDSSWASAGEWAKRQDKLREVLSQADRAGRPVALVRFSDLPQDLGKLPFGDAGSALGLVDGMVPAPFGPEFQSWSKALSTAQNDAFDTRWFSDGLANDARADLLEVLAEQGEVQVYEPNAPRIAGLKPPRIEAGQLGIDIIRAESGVSEPLTVDLVGPDPAGIVRRLATGSGKFSAGETETSINIELPSELRNRVTRIELRDIRTAATTHLTDDSIQRRKVALIGASQEQEGAALTEPLHFLRRALVPTAEVIEASLEDVLSAKVNVIILSDIGILPEADTSKLITWVEAGGLLVRFAGPRLAASDLGQAQEHPLLPVRLRAGGRSVGGAMSWGAPKRLREFDESSPFFGLSIPDDVTVKSQVMAQPDPTLATRALASLGDGTPLVTAKDLGLGRVVLFHVTSNAEWSTLPLSGLFVEMLDRLAISTRSPDLNKSDLAGLIWQPETILDGFGTLSNAEGLAGVEGAVLAEGVVGPNARPGLYANGERRVAFNVIQSDTVLERVVWPAKTPVSNLALQEEKPLKSWLLALAIALFALDGIATLLMTGGLRRAGKIAAFTMAVSIGGMVPQYSQAGDAEILAATSDTVLAFVRTGNARIDSTSEAGLLGLSTELFRRTSIEPVPPIGVDPELDELSVYPFLYWPLSEDQADLTDAGIARINTYLRTGGMILFDTRDANLGRGFSATVNGRKLQQIARGLDIPSLEPIPSDHVLTRSFYLLQDFPGRHFGQEVWAEAAPADAEQIEGMPFRNLNDGVTPVVIGSNDWAAAWAIDDNGNYLFPVGRGFEGDRQREMAFRFGINLVMHVLTGNYKSDQVHVPELLKRLGQ